MQRNGHKKVAWPPNQIYQKEKEEKKKKKPLGAFLSSHKKIILKH